MNADQGEKNLSLSVISKCKMDNLQLKKHIQLILITLHILCTVSRT